MLCSERFMSNRESKDYDPGKMTKSIRYSEEVELRVRMGRVGSENCQPNLPHLFLGRGGSGQIFTLCRPDLPHYRINGSQGGSGRVTGRSVGL
jgi:hypothetical protein